MILQTTIDLNLLYKMFYYTETFNDMKTCDIVQIPQKSQICDIIFLFQIFTIFLIA